MAVRPTNNQIVHLAHVVSEADDHSIPILLLKLKDILDGEKKIKRKIILIEEIWKYEFPPMILSALQLDYSTVSSSWLTACQLTSVLVECCVRYPSQRQRIEENFNNNFVMIVLQNISKMTGDYNRAERMFKDNLFANLSLMISSLTNFMETFSLLTCSVMSSKYLMQLLMMENNKLSTLVLSFIQMIIKINRGVFDHVNESRIHCICDELTFKITSSNDAKLARTSLSLLLTMMTLYRPLLDLFSSKRYRGFKLYLNKWMNQGFDADLNKLINVLDAQSEDQQLTRKHHNAAIMIQSFYRGYRDRKRLRKAIIAISYFQRHYRKRRNAKITKKEKKTLEKKKREYIETKRRKEFVGSRTKQLQIIEKIPARTVTKFLNNLQNESAKKIQAIWRGHKTRLLFLSQIPILKMEKAAVTIQRRIRKWLTYRRRKQSAILDLVPNGLTDERKVELQNVITKIRERFPTGSTSDEELQVKHEKAFRMLNNHVISLRQIRRRDEHRKALLAQLSVQTEQMSTLPFLNRVNEQSVKQYSSYSTPIVVAARKKHLETVYDLKKPWWERLGNDDVNDDVKKKVVMDYESKYLQDHEKQF